MAHGLPAFWGVRLRWPITVERGIADEAEGIEALRRLDGVMGAAVRRLAPEDQLFLALRFACGLSVAQVARVTHRSREEVRMQQLLTLRALQHELESRAS